MGEESTLQQILTTKVTLMKVVSMVKVAIS